LKLKILAGNFRYLQPTTLNIVEHGRPHFVGLCRWQYRLLFR